MRLFASAGKNFSYCRHSVPSVAFHSILAVNAVAVADVHGGRRGDALDGAVQRLDPPVGGLVHVNVEGRLVELDHVDAVGREPARFLVEQAGERHRHLHAVAVMGVGDGVDDGHRARAG